MNFPNLKYLFIYSTHQMWNKGVSYTISNISSLIFYTYTFSIQVNRSIVILQSITYGLYYSNSNTNRYSIESNRCSLMILQIILFVVQIKLSIMNDQGYDRFNTIK